MPGWWYKTRICDCFHSFENKNHQLNHANRSFGAAEEQEMSWYLISFSYHADEYSTYGLIPWQSLTQNNPVHYDDVTMSLMASQITSLMIAYSTVYSGADQRKHQSSASLAFVRGIHRGPVNSPHKWPVTQKMFPFDDVIMSFSPIRWHNCHFLHPFYSFVPNCVWLESSEQFNHESMEQSISTVKQKG